VVSEFFSLTDDFGFSVVDPDQVLLGGFDFFLEPFSVGGGFVSDSFILVSNGGQLSDLSAQGFFLGSVDFIGTGLRVDVGLFQVGQELESGINGVSSTHLHVHHGVQLRLEFGLVCEGSAGNKSDN